MRTLLPVFALPLFFAACGGGYVTPTTPTTPATLAPTPSTTLPPSISDDRSTFEATEKVFWGTVEAGTTVTRRWSGRAVQ